MARGQPDEWTATGTPAPRCFLRRHDTNTFAFLGMLVVAILAFVLANNAAAKTGFNPDESRWLSRAHYLADLADPFGPTWADQYMTRGQPPLGSYAIGLGLLLQGRDLKTNPPWDFALPWEVNVAIGNKPDAADLASGRRTSAALTAATAAVLIAVARVFLPQTGAIVAGALYAVHPFTSYIGSIAMSDALFGLLIALAAWAAAALARTPSWRRAVLLGALLGLGGATKLSPLVVAASLSAGGLLALAVSALRRLTLIPLPPSPGSDGRGGKGPRYVASSPSPCAQGDSPLRWRGARGGEGVGGEGRYGLIVGGVALLTFVLVYPYLWPDPIGRTNDLFAFRTQEMAAQASDWPVMAVPNRIEALRRVGVNFTERFSLSGSLATWLGGRVAPAPLRQVELVLPLAGIALMTGLAIRAGPFSAQSFVMLVLGGQVLVTIAAMRSEFDRYHLPMALLGAIAAAVALDWLVRASARVVCSPGTLRHAPEVESRILCERTRPGDEIPRSSA